MPLSTSSWATRIGPWQGRMLTLPRSLASSSRLSLRRVLRLEVGCCSQLHPNLDRRRRGYAHCQVIMISVHSVVCPRRRSTAVRGKPSQQECANFTTSASVNLVGKSVTVLEALNPPVRARSPVTTVPVLRFYSLKTLVFSACTEWHEYALRAGRQPLRPPIFTLPET